MSLYLKIIDEPTGRVVAPLEVLTGWDGTRWAGAPSKRILLKIHDLDRDAWIEPNEFRDDYYYFSQRFSAGSDRRYEVYHPRYPKRPVTVLPGGSTHFVARSSPRQRISTGTHRIELRLTPHHLVPFGGRDRFAFGANLAWYEGQYDHDFGPNSRYSPTRSAWLDPAASTYTTRFANLGTYFEHMRNQFKAWVVRIWVFEGCEGLSFGAGAISMDATIRTNVQRVLSLANSKDLYVYWCLLTSGPEHPGFNKDIDIIRSARNAASSPFLNGALRSFCQAIQGNDRTFAIDVMNEPEKYTTRGGVTWSDIRGYVRECCGKIKGYLGASILVSCGSAGTGWVNASSVIDTLKQYVGLGLDFYDYHIYNDSGELPMSYDAMYKALQDLSPPLTLDKPCIIGEFGQHRNGFLDEFQKGVVTNFMRQAWHLGFGGCLVWNYNHRDFDYSQRNDAHRHSLIYRNGSARPVVGPMSSFAGDYRAYMM